LRGLEPGKGQSSEAAVKGRAYSSNRTIKAGDKKPDA